MDNSPSIQLEERGLGLFVLIQTGSCQDYELLLPHTGHKSLSWEYEGLH